MSVTATVEPLEARRLLSADLEAAFAGAFATRVDPTPAHVAGSGHNKVVVRVGNRGDAPAAGTSVTLYASADGTLDAADVPLATTIRAKSLGAGKSANLKVRFDRPADLPDGNYQLLARVTDAAGTADATPGDDVAIGPAPAAFRAPFVDLGAAVSWQPDGPVSTVGLFGRLPPEVTVGVDVFNAGNAIAKVPVGVTLYLSADGALDPADVAVATVTPGKAIKLVPGRAQTVTLTFRLPADLPPGSYKLLAVVDPTNVVAEAQEGNNVTVSDDPVEVVDTPVGRPPRHHHEHHYHYFGYGGDVFLFDGYEAYGDYVDGGSVYVEPPPPAWTDPDPPATNPSTNPATNPSTDPADPSLPDPGGDPPTDAGDPPATQPSTGPSTQPADGGGGDSGGGDAGGGDTGGGNDGSGGTDHGDDGSSGGGKSDNGGSGGGDSGGSESGGSDSGNSDSGGGDFGGRDE